MTRLLAIQVFRQAFKAIQLVVDVHGFYLDAEVCESMFHAHDRTSTRLGNLQLQGAETHMPVATNHLQLASETLGTRRPRNSTRTFHRDKVGWSVSSERHMELGRAEL